MATAYCILHTSSSIGPIFHETLLVVSSAGTMQVEQSTRSTNRSFKKLISVNGIEPEEIHKALCGQTVELVFTAHPTQVLLQGDGE